MVQIKADIIRQTHCTYFVHNRDQLGSCQRGEHLNLLLKYRIFQMPRPLRPVHSHTLKILNSSIINKNINLVKFIICVALQHTVPKNIWFYIRAIKTAQI